MEENRRNLSQWLTLLSKKLFVLFSILVLPVMVGAAAYGAGPYGAGAYGIGYVPTQDTGGGGGGGAYGGGVTQNVSLTCGNSSVILATNVSKNSSALLKLGDCIQLNATNSSFVIRANNVSITNVSFSINASNVTLRPNRSEYFLLNASNVSYWRVQLFSALNNTANLSINFIVNDSSAPPIDVPGGNGTITPPLTPSGGEITPDAIVSEAWKQWVMPAIAALVIIVLVYLKFAKRKKS